jgi:hypothetical protein
MKTDYQTRVLMLLIRQAKMAILYTPLSHRGQRAARLIPRLKQILSGVAA